MKRSIAITKNIISSPHHVVGRETTIADSYEKTVLCYNLD